MGQLMSASSRHSMFSSLLATALLLLSLQSGPSLGDSSQYSQYPAVNQNSVYDTSYDYSGYQSGLYERQDGLSLTDLSFPMLATAFAAALLASLIGPSLATNMGRMLSLDFKMPEFKAIPISTGRLLGEISEASMKYQD